MSTYSPSLRIQLINTGDQAGVWGNTTNVNLGTLIESAIAGYISVSVTTANQALTANDGIADESRNMVLALTTTTTAAFSVYAPPAEKLYVVYNASAYAATIFNSSVLGNTTAAGTGVVIPAGRTMSVWSDGTNFALQNTNLQTSVTGSIIGSAGTTAQRDGSPAAGFFRFNTTTGYFEGYDGTAWGQLAEQTGTTGSLVTSSGTTAQRDGSPAAGFFRFNSTTNRFEGYNGSAWLPLNPQSSVTGSLITAAGTTAERDASPAGGFFRFNTDTDSWEGYDGTVWKAVGGGATGGGADEVFVENGQNVTVDYTLPSTRNAMSTGPITVNSGITVTVSSGSRWVVL
jgi:hypothetical protein